MSIEEKLITVCADSPERLRACDCGRLFEIALEEDCVSGMKVVLKSKNLPALQAFEETPAIAPVA